MVYWTKGESDSWVMAAIHCGAAALPWSMTQSGSALIHTAVRTTTEGWKEGKGDDHSYQMIHTVSILLTSSEKGGNHRH